MDNFFPLWARTLLEGILTFFFIYYINIYEIAYSGEEKVTLKVYKSILYELHREKIERETFARATVQFLI